MSSDGCRPRCVPFLRQSIRSDYCGVYATGMLLSYLGHNVDRRKSRDLFGLRARNPDYTGASPRQIRHVVVQTASLRCARWRTWVAFDFERVSKAVAAHIQCTEAPSLLVCGVVHRRLRLRSLHVVVAVGVSSSDILVLDPLAPPPEPGMQYNVRFTGGSARELDALGAVYRVSLRERVMLLTWSPQTQEAWT